MLLFLLKLKKYKAIYANQTELSDKFLKKSM